MKSPNEPTQPSSYEKKVALVLQGGGALGSYQAGVYEALADTKYAPDWVAGISIGAINAAIIAGNAPADRVPRLRTFWKTITAPSAYWVAPDCWPFDIWQRHASALRSLSFGQPGFFHPRLPVEWNPLAPPLSYYDTSSLKATLLQLVDFDRINRDKNVRLSVGAVNVRSARFAYFDSAEITIRPEHVYPICKPYQAEHGCLRARHAVRFAINELEELPPESVKETPQAKRLHEFGCVTEMDIVQLIYRPMSPLGPAKDYEFGRSTMTARWNQGKADATVTLAAAPWLDPSPPEVGVRIFDVVHDMLMIRQSRHVRSDTTTTPP
jgi:hypothetical protein